MSHAMLGLELHDHLAIAVAIDHHGLIRERAEAADADLGRAALTALDRVGAETAGGQGGMGVAAYDPESAGCRAVIEALAPRYTGPFRREGAVPSGVSAAMAEAWIGAARDRRDVLYLAVAEHASAGIVRGGTPLFGAHRRAPAVGWLALNPVEREDYRRTGCVEAEVASAGIVRRVVSRIKAGDRSGVQDRVGGDLTAITPDHVLEAARAGDGVSISVVRDTVRYLAMAAANLVVIVDPEVLVLGGIMASAKDLLFEPVRAELSRRVPSAVMQTLAVVPAALGADAAAIGAARLAAVAAP